MVLSFFLFSCDNFMPVTSINLEEVTSVDETDIESELRMIYQLALESSEFTGTYEEWLESVRGPRGEDGKSIIIRLDDNILQWQYQGDEEWIDLLDLSTLEGEDGVSPTIEINDDGYWVINGQVTSILAGIEDGSQYVTVTFNLDGGLLPNDGQENLSVERGYTIDLPIPSKEGYIFKGWFVGETINDGQFFNHIPFAKDTTLYARWIDDPGYQDDDLLNHFYFRVLEKNDAHIKVELLLGGHVETCGFDIKMNYSSELVTFSSSENLLSGLVMNANTPGEVHLNYVSSNQNITTETVIGVFDFSLEAFGSLSFELDILQAIVLESNGLDLSNTSSNSTPLSVLIEE